MELEEALRSGGARVTHARRVVWDVLTEAERHLTAQQVAEGVERRDAGVNQSSVYRALSLFAELGLVRESRLDEVSTWEPAHDDDVIHLRCTVCNRVIHHHTRMLPELRRELEAAGFRPDAVDLTVTGHCC